MRNTRAPISNFTRALNASANLDLDLEALSPETLARIDIRAREIMEQRPYVGWLNAQRFAAQQIVEGRD